MLIRISKARRCKFSSKSSKRFGWGEIRVYQEDKYQIDEGTKGITYEGMYEYQVDTKKSSFGRTRGVSLLKTDFVDHYDGADGSTIKTISQFFILLFIILDTVEDINSEVTQNL